MVIHTGCLGVVLPLLALSVVVCQEGVISEQSLKQEDVGGKFPGGAAAFDASFDPFDDGIYYKLRWPGDNKLNEDSFGTVGNSGIKIPDGPPLLREGEDDGNFLWVTTAKKETYYCVLPKALSKGGSPDGSKNAFDGFSPYQILKPLFTREVCSYRLEQYWTYELCHGRYVRQFHEESTLQKVKGQEYYLGKYDLIDLADTEKAFESKLAEIKQSGQKRPTITVDGVQLPYIEFNMTSGTVCDISGKSRVTRVRYVCSEDSKHELHTIKEIYTCEYEAVVLSPLLCLHSDFRINVAHENDINCYSVGNSPAKPTGLTDIESKMRRETKSDNLFDGKTIIIDAAELSGKDTFGLDITIQDEDGNKFRASSSGRSTKESSFLSSTPDKPKYDTKIIKEFLSGELCLQGGTGWWKYEFCYGDKVVQYHEDKGQRTTVITLGKWDKGAHDKWLDANPAKRIKQGKTPRQVSHFYGGGDICGEHKNPRQVEVKLKCKPVDGSIDSVALYLLEPKTCEYVLGIESSIVCGLLSTVDENGIMHNTQESEQVDA